MIAIEETDDVDGDDVDRGLCEVCRVRPAETGRVCPADLDIIARQLHDLPGQMRRLEAQVVPGARRGDGQPAGSKPGGSPVPARLDALSLLGPGSVSVSAMMHPHVRHWQTRAEVDVRVVRTSSRIAGGRTVHTADVVVERRPVTVWHREFDLDPGTGRPVMVADDDQIGALPPREWLASWVAQWQELLHRNGPPARRYPPGQRRPAGSFRSVALARLAAQPDLAGLLAGMYAVRQAYDHAVQATLAGQSYGFSGDVTRWARTDDPLIDDLEARFGPTSAAEAVTRSVAFLLLWLDEAAAHPGMPIRDFAGELRSVSAELTRTLGEAPAQQWIGRCPARLTDPATGATRPCGAGIWQDPHASQVQCPRCHCTWGPRRVEWLRLAQEMRATWPVDRRRRYTDDERVHTRRPKCPACGLLAQVQWREVTGLGDPVRTWQAAGAVCPSGCPEAREVI